MELSSTGNQRSGNWTITMAVGRTLYSSGQILITVREFISSVPYIIITTTFSFLADELPKTVMFNYAIKNGRPIPVYKTEQRHKLFRSVMQYDGKEYATSYWEKNKKFAEQGAALAGMLELGLISRDDLLNSGSLVA